MRFTIDFFVSLRLCVRLFTARTSHLRSRGQACIP
jgi:hypothetical protein